MPPSGQGCPRTSRGLSNEKLAESSLISIYLDEKLRGGDIRGVTYLFVVTYSCTARCIYWLGLVDEIRSIIIQRTPQQPERVLCIM